MHTYPALHNAMWPGLVGKGPDSEPPIDLETMLNLTAAANVGGVKFEGVDLFLFDPHVSIDSSDEDLKRLADQVASRNLVVGSLVAPVWPPTGGGSAMGSADDRKNFVTQASFGSTRPRARATGRLIPRPTRRRSPKRSGKRATSPTGSASGLPRKARSAGAACTAGNATSSCSRW